MTKRTSIRPGSSAGGNGKRAPARHPETPGFNPAECPVGWLSRRRDKDGQPMISQNQLAAAERLRADFWFAGMTPRVTSSWSPAGFGGASRRSAPGTGVDLQDAQIAAAERVRRALAAVGPELTSILIDVCCHLKRLESVERTAGWPQRSAKVILQLALTRLARHYGFERDPAHAGPSRPHVRHWGADGFRPAADASDPD